VLGCGDLVAKLNMVKKEARKHWKPVSKGEYAYARMYQYCGGTTKDVAVKNSKQVLNQLLACVCRV